MSITQNIAQIFLFIFGTCNDIIPCNDSESRPLFEEPPYDLIATWHSGSQLNQERFLQDIPGSEFENY